MEECKSSVTVLSWNVNGFWGKRSTILNHLNPLKADVVFLQETHLGPNRDLPPGTIMFHDLTPGYDWAVFNVYKANSRGVAVLFRRGICCEGLQVVGDKKGRYMIITCELNGQDFVFVNMYNPCDEKIVFQSDCDLAIKPPKSGFIVVGGDFNTVLETELDKTSDMKNRGHKDRLKGLLQFLRKYNLVDIWRCLHPEEKNFTYFGMGNKGKSRLDYFFIPEIILRRVMACKVHVRPEYSEKEGYVSDHAPISIQISTGDTWWQFDRSLLGDEHSTGHFLNVLKKFSQRKTKRKAELWVGLKLRVQCEENACKKRKHEEAEEEIVRRRPITCNDALAQAEATNHMSVLQLDKFSKTSDLRRMRNSDTQQISLPCHRFDLEEYLDKLYNTNKSEELRYILNFSLMEQISKKEILSTIASLSDFHVQTPDGIPVVFYQHFACQLTNYLQAFFNQVLSLQPLSEMLRESFACKHVFPNSLTSQIICHDHTYCNSNKALFIASVFNVDYIIFSSILAHRLNNIMGHLLNPGQSTSSCMTVDSCIKAITRVNENKTPTIVITLKMHTGDVKWSYLFKSLKEYNLPKKFQILLRALVTRGRSFKAMFCCHSFSGPVDSQTQGLRLGCPLTPVLIQLCLQALIESINNEERLRGVEVLDGQVVKALSESDTALIFLTYTAEALEILEDILARFTAKSGLIVNENLSEVFICGTCESNLRSGKLKLLHQTTCGFYYQGCYVTSDCLG